MHAARQCALMVSLGLLACTTVGVDPPGAGDTVSGDPGSGDSTGDPIPGDPTPGDELPGDFDRVYQNVPLQSSVTKVQPMTGIVLWEDSWGSSTIKTSDEYIQLEYAYVRPSNIVTAQSTYDWSSFNAFLNRIAERSHQAIVRFYYVYPGEQTAVPQYIKNLGDYSETQGTSEGEPTWFPDWTHAELERFHLEFFSELAAAYDEDPRIAFLQVGFGLWGEYHIYDGPNTVGVHFPSKSFQETFVDHLDTVLTSLHWSISIDAGDDYYSPFSTVPSLLLVDFGNFDDSFMHEEHGDYNESMWIFFDHTERYKRSPHGGELSYYSTYDQQHALDVGGMYGRTYEELSADFHITYMIGNDQPSHQTDARIRDAGMANGYEFEITAFRTSSNHSLVNVRNAGIAPIYYDAYVTVNGTRSADSLLGLLPGHTREYAVNAGGVSPILTIECDRLVAGQQIQFAADL